LFGKQYENYLHHLREGNRPLQLTSINDITRKYRHIFLSPHFDDVVYSCGGTLGVQVCSGLHPLVITIFGGAPPATTPLSPFAQYLHGQWGADPAYEPNLVEMSEFLPARVEASKMYASQITTNFGSQEKLV
jgi:hypothetical protein